MAATFGAEEVFGLTVPSGGHVEESSSDSSVELATVKNNVGVTVIAVPRKMVTTNLSIKGRGDPALSAVTSGAITAGTLKVTSAKGTESKDDFPAFEITAVKFTNLA